MSKLRELWARFKAFFYTGTPKPKIAGVDEIEQDQAPNDDLEPKP